MINKPKVEYDRKGAQGNIYHLLGLCREAMRKARLITAYNDLRDKVYASGSYNEAINCIKEYIDLVDISE